MIKRTLLLAMALIASLATNAQTGQIKTDEFHFASLEGNLVGDSAKRTVFVYLPPGYERDKKTRYPVVYLLHGFNGYGVGNKLWLREGGAFNVETISRLISENKISPMIIVLPDGSNRYGGSMYTNSITTGNWEDYIVRELVAFIDKNYRTLPRAESRGIAGHSMGGYGALKIAMKHPDVFGSVYGTSSCCLVYPPPATNQKTVIDAASLGSFEEADKSPFGVRASFGMAAAWSPNPSKPPFFADYPVNIDGVPEAVSSSALARWQANIPMFMVDQYATNLRRLREIAFDAGTQEEFIRVPNVRFSEFLKSRKIDHIYEVFDGGHNDKVRERVETRMLPFFSRTLVSHSSAIKSR